LIYQIGPRIIISLPSIVWGGYFIGAGDHFMDKFRQKFSTKK
jgi:hypothetical protein